MKRTPESARAVPAPAEKRGVSSRALHDKRLLVNTIQQYNQPFAAPAMVNPLDI